MMYGFVVIVWLIFPNGASIPFTTMEACESARLKIEDVKVMWKSQKIDPQCLPTGAPPGKE